MIIRYFILLLVARKLDILLFLDFSWYPLSISYQEQFFMPVLVRSEDLEVQMPCQLYIWTTVVLRIFKGFMSTELYKDAWDLKQKHSVLCPLLKTISLNYFSVSDECNDIFVTFLFIITDKITLSIPHSKKKTHFTDLVNYSSLTSLFYYHEWSRQNFFLQYQCNIKQTSDEDKKISIKGLLLYPLTNSPIHH